MKPSQPARRTLVLRNTCTIAAILGFGVLAGALLAETSVMNLSLLRPAALRQRSAGIAGNVNGYLMPADSAGRTRRPLSQPHGISAHHTGL